MIELIDLKRACNRLLQERYPELGIYGIDTTEGFIRPCFSTEIVPYGLRYESRNWAKNRAAYKITYLQEMTDEEDQLEKVLEIRDIFGMKLAVGRRKIGITNYSHEYAGEYNDWLQITVEFEWYDNITRIEPDTIIEHVSVDMKQRGE